MERRRSPRLKPVGLLAHYWTGGSRRPSPVREISLSGAVIDDPAVYYPGTVIRVALEDVGTNGDRRGSTLSADIWAKVLRNVADGFCVAFIFENQTQRSGLSRLLDELRKRGVHARNAGDAQ